MTPFTYTRPATLAEATALLLRHAGAACALAGGTDLIVQMQAGRKQPQVVVDIKNIPELGCGITAGNGLLRIGALATLAEIAAAAPVRRGYAALAEAAAAVGSVQIRQRATLAGNICNASPAADTAPALLVHAAQVRIAGPRGRRVIALSAFFRGPGSTALQPGELVKALELPITGDQCGSTFQRLARRRGVDLASVSVACRLAAGGLARVAFGAVGPTPLLAEDASGVLTDRRAPSKAVDEALARLAGIARPITDLRAGAGYRRAMILVLCRRAHAAALERLWNPSS